MFEPTVDLGGGVRVLVVISGETKRDVHPERRRRQVPKSKRTSPASIFRRASNFLPAFDSNPLSTAVRPMLEERPGRADADGLPGDLLPDRKPAPRLPAAAAEGLFLLHDLGPAAGTAADRNRPEPRWRLRVTECAGSRPADGSSATRPRSLPPDGCPPPRSLEPPPSAFRSARTLRDLARVGQVEKHLARSLPRRWASKSTRAGGARGPPRPRAYAPGIRARARTGTPPASRSSRSPSCPR